MNKAVILLLGLMPAMAFGVVCKTVDEHGIVTYTQVQGSSCAEGTALPQYPNGPRSPRVNAADTGVSVREVAPPEYRSFSISRPAPHGTVRSNDGSFSVTVQTEPELWSGHFITVFIDEAGFDGRYGESEVPVSGVERGTHSIRAVINDTTGTQVAQTETTQFTLHGAPERVQVRGYDKDSQDLYGGVLGSVVTAQDLAALPTGTKASNVEVKLVIAGKDYLYQGKVVGRDPEILQKYGVTPPVPGAIWIVEDLPEDQLRAAEQVTVTLQESGQQDGSRAFEFDRTEEIRRIFGAVTGSHDYRSVPGADYAPPGQGISTTPGRTNPAFAPNYSR